MLAGRVRAGQVGGVSGRSVVLVGCHIHQVCCGCCKGMRLAVAFTKRAVVVYTTKCWSCDRVLPTMMPSRIGSLLAGSGDVSSEFTSLCRQCPAETLH